MIVINKDYLKEYTEMDWLREKMDDNFELKINDGISKMVFGYNGVGKSSLVKLLMLEKELFRFLSYERINSAANNIDYDSNRLVISVNNKKINVLEKEKNKIKQLLEFSHYSDSKFTKSRINKLKNRDFINITNSLFDKKKTINVINDFQVYSKFINKYDKVEPKIFYELIVNISKVNDVEKELNSFKNNKIFELLLMANELVNENDRYCPICGKEELKIKEIIENKVKELNNVVSEFAKELSNKGIIASKEVCEQYISLYNEIVENPSLLNDFAIIGKNVKIFQEIVINNERYNSIIDEIYKLETIKKQMFLEVLKHRDFFIDDICKYLKIGQESIEFDESNCEVIIRLPRNISTYSTGEQHILAFIYELYSFIGSESETLIMDDPVSSLDMVNMYKIGYEIVDKLKIKQKNMVVFSHSTELINIVHSQSEGKIEFYYLEQINGKLFCEQIAEKGAPNLFTIENLFAINENFFRSLKEKEENPKCTEAGVWHFEEKENVSNIDPNLSNYALIDNIENYTTLEKQDFYLDTFNKIKIMASLRIWLEKKLYELIPSDNVKRRNSFLKKNTLNQRINVIIKYGNEMDLLKINNIKIEHIMTKKVMLNQNCHYYSQVLPFSYAINLSIDDINSEVMEIKKIFH